MGTRIRAAIAVNVALLVRRVDMGVDEVADFRGQGEEGNA